MSKNVVVLGATGYIGQGATLQLLKAGYTVVAQSREQKKLDVLKETLIKRGADVSKLHFVTGSFQSDAEAKAVADAVTKLIGVPQHVLSILGFSVPINGPASEGTPDAINHNFVDTFWPTVRSANAFIPLQKGKVACIIICHVWNGWLTGFCAGGHLYAVVRRPGARSLRAGVVGRHVQGEPAVLLCGLQLLIVSCPPPRARWSTRGPWC